MMIFVACIITVVVETLFFRLANYRGKYFFVICMAVNVATNLSLNILLGFIDKCGGNITLLVYPLECAVVVTEYLVYAALEGNSWKLAGMTCAANFLSYVSGLIIFGHV